MPKKKHKVQLNTFISQIPKNNLWIPEPFISLTDSEQHNPSSFSIKSSNHNYKLNTTDFKPLNIKYESPLNEVYKAQKIDIHFTKDQKLIINEWFNASTAMYNDTINFIKYQIKNSGNIYKTVKGVLTLDWIKIRNLLKSNKQHISFRSAFKSNGKTKTCCKKCKICKCNNMIKIHDLDLIIKLASEMYQSALTNFKRKNIKQFRIKKWKFDRKIKILKLEKTNFTSGSIRKNILGNVYGYYDGQRFDFKSIDNDCTLIYNGFTDKYTLCVTKQVKKSYNVVQKQIISLDPGIRTFITGISENEVIKIGEGSSKKIEHYLKKLDHLKYLMDNKYINNMRKKSKEILYQRKINNFVDEMHWKSIKYLTNNFNTILIGDLSCIGVVKNDKSILNNMNKRICYRLKFFQFRQRLSYKCNSMNINYKCVDEKYTSMTCSNCGNINYSLGNDKFYDCNNCNKKIDRDVNGARNIYIKATL